jgi:hypothetical protein
MRFDTSPIDIRLNGAFVPPLAATANSGSFLTQTVVGAAPPVVSNIGTGMKLALTSASQAQCLQVNCKDLLPWDIDEIAYVAIDAYIPAAELLSVAAVRAFIGLGSAMNADYSAMTNLIGFSVAGGGTQGNVFAEADDNLSDKAADTGLAMPTSLRTFWIDLYSGVKPGYGSAAARGGKEVPRFYISDTGASPNRGNRREVCKTTDFSMGNYAGNLQPIIQIEKASGTGTGSLVVSRVRAWLRDSFAT